MELLSVIRSSAGKRLTTGLPDHVIERFLIKDVNLALAIRKAHHIWKSGEFNNSKSEEDMIKEIHSGFCVFYPEETRNPYIPSAAKGPWIITLHGAVIHDNGGYGMLGFGHGPDFVIKAMSEDVVMANIMTANIAQSKFMKAIRKEVGHARVQGCPYVSFLMMNSGSEGNSVALRLIDLHTGKFAGGRSVKGISMKGSFHGRTHKPAVLTDSCAETYQHAQAYSINIMRETYAWTCPPNDVKALRELFDKAKRENVFIEVVLIESVMGEGNPGAAVTPEFYTAVRELTLGYNTLLLVDNIQAGLRCTGNLSIVDYDGFTDLPPPDFEVFSKAINAGQYPVSCVALSERAQSLYVHGIYGNTMTGNPRACMVSAAVLNCITPALRKNICDMGKYAVQKYEALQREFPQTVERVTGTGLLYAVKLNKNVFTVVAADGVEQILRRNGLGVIHGGENALRFTPHFNITTDEIDLQVDMVRDIVSRVPINGLAKLAACDKDVSQSSTSAQITLRGHLFDNNVLNNVLNVVENFSAKVHVTHLELGSNRTEQSCAQLTMDSQRLTELVAKIRVVAAAGGCTVTSSI